MTMNSSMSKRGQDITLPLLRQDAHPTVADQVFDTLQQRILTLELPPHTKISEAEVSKLMNVSRQPVREAFKRLAKLGFLNIRPQSSTTVSLISEEAVLRAHFIRTALEVKICSKACETSTPQNLAPLHALIAELNRYRPGRLRCHPAVGQLRVSGAFPLRDTDASLDLLRKTLPVDIGRSSRWWVTVEPRG